MLIGVGVSCRISYSIVSYLYLSFSELGKRALISLQSFTFNYVVSVRRGFCFLLVLGIGCFLLCHFLGLSYNYYAD